jgi:protease-4
LVLIPALALSVFAQACISVSLTGKSSDRGEVASEVVQPAKGLWTEDQVLLIPLSGLVAIGDMNTGFSGNAGMLVELQDRLKAARKNHRIRAVVLRIDSPGGTVTASDLIYRELVRFKQETKLPVIALLGDIAASGGLYVAMAADEIYALPTTTTGSIGVIMISPNLEGMMSKLGVRINVIKSGKLKDAGSLWRALTDEERQVFQNIIDHDNQRFRNVIYESRKNKGLTREGLARIADGRVLTPEQAGKARLIDGISYPEELYKHAMMRANISDADVVSYEYPAHYRGNIYAQAAAAEPRAETGGGAPIINLFPIQGQALMQEIFGARFLYIWAP